MFIVKRQINHFKLRRSEQKLRPLALLADMYLTLGLSSPVARDGFACVSKPLWSGNLEYDEKYVFDWVEYGEN